MKDLKTYINESQNATLEDIAKQLFYYLKADKHFDNNKENAMKFLDLVEELLKEYNLRTFASFASGVMQHSKDKY